MPYRIPLKNAGSPGLPPKPVAFPQGLHLLVFFEVHCRGTKNGPGHVQKRSLVPRRYCTGGCRTGAILYVMYLVGGFNTSEKY